MTALSADRNQVPAGTSAELLAIRNLSVTFDGAVAVEHVDFDIAAGEVVGVVGESGSGKSVTMLALMGLIDAPGRVRADLLRFDGHSLLELKERARRRIVGRDIAMVFQDAQSSLNPSYSVGFQVGEALRQHEGLRGRALEQRVLGLLDQVEIPDAKNRMGAYPHQLSGGMNQRVMIAMAIACNPKLLIADEPTTALDVTIQAQIMTLLRNLQRDRGMAMVLISHDLAVVSEIADRVAVMYAGEVVEQQRVPAVFERPHHPYTEALLAAIPEHNRGARRLAALGGMVPGRYDRPQGCLFAPRCPYVEDACRAARPPLVPCEADGPNGLMNGLGGSPATAPAAHAGLVRCIKPLHRAPAARAGHGDAR
ncbi:ABC transporter ATP-binding protein [Robbsia sp. Bb-Pol-6]|uniref:ABC transporter ATP-binding protein n=1 Tax=Robbsia betulipollinis TaxID=2981849 RepID=A0ABT3ZK79_9BURK|nr:ABC transporter ATP-binding protein [Robbsia betulipollinis]MCY0386935.1 ABC transporter ATP-binding protein [Robbsia betulipollinis]